MNQNLPLHYLGSCRLKGISTAYLAAICQGGALAFCCEQPLASFPFAWQYFSALLPFALHQMSLCVPCPVAKHHAYVARKGHKHKFYHAQQIADIEQLDACMHEQDAVHSDVLKLLHAQAQHLYHVLTARFHDEHQTTAKSRPCTEVGCLQVCRSCEWSDNKQLYYRRGAPGSIP